MRSIELNDPSIGLRGFLALDATHRGPAFGGIRVARYSDISQCRADAEKLARAMSLKCAFHEIPGGGGKVALDADAIIDRDRVMRRLAAHVNELDGQFFTGPDTGLTDDDIRVLSEATTYVTREDVTEATADGVLFALFAACEHAGVDPSNSRVVVQGLGAVGLKVADALVRGGAEVMGTDLDKIACREARALGVEIIEPDQAIDTPADVFAPCALGGVIDASAASRLSCKVIAGAANNVLARDDLAEDLLERGIVLVPDFVANGGGVVRGAWVHLRGWPGTDSEIASIYHRTRDLLTESSAAQVSPLSRALELAEEKLRTSGGSNPGPDSI